jgi:serine/threonine protein kinase
MRVRDDGHSLPYGTCVSLRRAIFLPNFSKVVLRFRHIPLEALAERWKEPPMHPGRQELVGLILGTLDDRQAEAVVAHLANCLECEDTIRGLENEADELLLDLRQPVLDDRFECEPNCRRFVDVVKQIGGKFSFTALPRAAASSVELTDLGDLGQYQLVAKLGQGGMGAVFKAMHARLRKLVALKILPIERMQNAGALARFEREMQVVGQLNHPHIVAALDAGEANGVHYLVMELVEGVDLSRLWRRLAPLDIADACELVRQAAVGLEHAHQRGMVHRDIKPSNLMLAALEDGGTSVKILDLGLALWEGAEQAGPSDLTASGQTMGTFEYMAPEQGLDSHVVDQRADLYALGATLYKLLAGEGPFADPRYNTPLRLMVAKATTPAPSLAIKRSDAPAPLVTLVDQLLAMNPDDRPASAAEVAASLLPFAAGADLKALLDAASFDSETELLDQSVIGTHEHLSRGSHDTPPTLKQPLQPESRDAPDAQPTQSAAASLALAPAKVDGPHDKKAELAKRVSRSLVAWTGAMLAAVLAIGFVLFLRTDHGVIVVEIEDPTIRVALDGGTIQITERNSGQPIEVSPGQHRLHVTRGNLRFTTDQFELNRGEKLLLRVARLEGQVRVFQRGELIGKANIPADSKVANVPSRDNSQAKSPSDGVSRPRQAALAVLQVGGRVEIKTPDSDPRWFERAESLPTVPFSIEWIEVHRDRAEPITINWLRDVLAGASELEGIALHEQALGDAAMPLLAKSGSLTHAMMSDVGITDAGLAALAALPLVQLNIGKNQIGDPGIRALGAPTNLKLLVLTETQITDEALRHMAAWPHLQSLSLASTAITDRGLAHLEKLTSLREIDLDGTQVTREGVKRFRRALPRCRVTSNFDP